MNGNISIVIGSWGSYNECNELRIVLSELRKGLILHS